MSEQSTDQKEISDVAKILKDPNATKAQKKAAAAELAKRAKRKQTGIDLDDRSSQEFTSKSYANNSRKAGGSTKSQARKKV